MTHSSTCSEHIPFLKTLPLADRGRIETVIIRKKFARNQIIALEGDDQHFLYVVESGGVKVIRSDGRGKEQILAIHVRGDFFGEMAILDGKTVPATIVALEPSRIAFISAPDFNEHILGNVEALKGIVDLLCRRLRESWTIMGILRLGDADHRIRGILRHMASHHGVRDARGTIISLPLTHQQIADYAAVARETVTRTLNRFADKGEIEIIDNRKIILTTLFDAGEATGTDYNDLLQ